MAIRSTPPRKSAGSPSTVAIGHLAEHVHHLSARNGEDIEWNKYEHAVLAHFGLSDEDYQDIVEGR